MSGAEPIHIPDYTSATETGIEVDVNGKILIVPPPFVNFKDVFADIKSFKSRSSDIWICTYPKAGTHWTNEILLLMLHGHASAKSKTRFMLEACKTIDDFEGLSTSRPRLLNTHTPLKYLPSQILESKIVYVIRNPLSIALSAYHHIATTDYAYRGTPSEYIELFAEENPFSFFGSWFEHVKQAADASRNHPNVLLMFYEEMVESPIKAVREIAKFGGHEMTTTEVEDIVKQTALKQMKERFQKIYHDEINGKGVDSSVLIRKGEIAEWRNHVTPAFLKQFIDRFNKELHEYPEIVSRIKI